MSQIDVTFTNLSQLSRAYGTPAVDMATAVIQTSARGQLNMGLALLAITLVMFVLVAAAILTGDDDDNMGKMFFAIFGGIGTAVLAITCLFIFTDIWMWTALSNPQLALAHQIFGSMGGQ